MENRHHDSPIILTNDDGIDAPGLDCLARCLGDRHPWLIVAPDGPRSGIGHQVTVRDDIDCRAVAERRYRISGSPADCARIAIKAVAPGAGWLIAGINPGANLGSDVYNSGTVAAAREAAILGIRAIAISQYIAPDSAIDWDATHALAAPVIDRLLHLPIPAHCFWNVNLPHPLSVESPPSPHFCALDLNPHDYRYIQTDRGYRYRGRIHDRPRTPGHDVAVCFDEHRIAVTLLGVDCTVAASGSVP